jgi:hypothetical protein
MKMARVRPRLHEYYIESRFLCSSCSLWLKRRIATKSLARPSAATDRPHVDFSYQEAAARPTRPPLAPLMKGGKERSKVWPSRERQANTPPPQRADGFARLSNYLMRPTSIPPLRKGRLGGVLKGVPTFVTRWWATQFFGPRKNSDGLQYKGEWQAIRPLPHPRISVSSAIRLCFGCSRGTLGRGKELG